MNQNNNSKPMFIKRDGTPVFDKEFTDKDTGATVYVLRKKTAVGMEYWLGVGFLDGDIPRRTYAPKHQGVGKVTMEQGLGDIISNLWEQAEEYVLRCYQMHEDARIEKDIERGKPNHKAPPPGLKKLGKMDAKKRVQP